jgi:alkylation response protein AidB-like acyl-CoA dehydrogenase
MAARCEQARCLLFYAALAFEAGREDALTQASAARVIAQQAAMKNADANIQLHGGIGVTDDLPAHFFLKRAILFGNWLCGTGQQLDHILFQPIGDI